MAQGADLLDQGQLTCLICLDLLEEPVTIPCGHSFCLGCIRGCWGQDDQTAVYSCPQCNETFTQKPYLRGNTILAEVVRKLKQAGLRATAPDQSYAGPGDVACDVCSGRKCKAIKSCMVCLASYCQTHLKLHDSLNPGKRHKLTDASGNLQERICSRHDKLLEIYCRTDQQCICYLCTMDEHRGHDTVSAAAERTEKQMKLGQKTTEFQKRIQLREKDLMNLKKAVQTLEQSTQTAVKDSDKVFTEMIQSTEKRRSEVKQLFRDQEKAEVCRAAKLRKRLVEEIAGLKRRAAELEQLSHTEDDIHFLQVCQCFCTPAGPEDLVSITINTNISFESVMASVSSLKEELEPILQRKLDEISGVKEAHIVEPRTRKDFLLYSCQLTLDPNTADERLTLSKENRLVTYPDQTAFGSCHSMTSNTATFGYSAHGVPLCQPASRFINHPQNSMHAVPLRQRASRFQKHTQNSVHGVAFGQPSSGFYNHPQNSQMHAQVLCGKGLLGGCHYWEVEWKGNNGVYVAVSNGISSMGCNDNYWSLFCSPSRWFFIHNDRITNISITPSSRVGVYMDHRAGMLSFYSVSGEMTLLHRVQIRFTEPLYPGFWVGSGCGVKLVDLE